MKIELTDNELKAKKMYIKGKSYKEIEKECDISANRIRYLRSKDNWKQLKDEYSRKKKETKDKGIRKAGAQPGNKHALGCGAPKGNSNNLKHGRYAKVFWETLDETELQIYNEIEIDEEEEIKEQIKLLIIRERRYLIKIAEIRKKLHSEKEEDKYLTFEKEKVNIKNERTYQDEKFEDGNYTDITDETRNKDIHVEQLLNQLEKNLTDIQERKRRAVESLMKIKQIKNTISVSNSKLDIEKFKVYGDADNEQDNNISDFLNAISLNNKGVEELFNEDKNLFGENDE